jgi:hypothetical protein
MVQWYLNLRVYVICVCVYVICECVYASCTPRYGVGVYVCVCVRERERERALLGTLSVTGVLGRRPHT